MPKKKRRPRKPVRHHKPQSPRVQRSRTPSFGDNVIAYAVHQGVDVTDPDALNHFMAYYNALPHEERVAISDRSEERRVGKEWRCRGSREEEEENKPK